MNVDISKLQPGVFGVSHGHGVGAMIIRHATGSWAGHAFLYLGNNQIVSGDPPSARIEPATKYADSIWAWQMWDKLAEEGGIVWSASSIEDAQKRVVNRGHALVGCTYDWPAYIGFTAEVLSLRNEGQLSSVYQHDTYRTCSALVNDAETFGGVPMIYTREDGPGLIRDSNISVTMPPNLVAPGMLLGLAQRLEWT
jgi:hypothetical protein